MDLQEQLTAVTAERDRYFEMLKAVNAEKVSFDQQLLSTLKQVIELRKELYLVNDELNKFKQPIASEVNSFEQFGIPAVSDITIQE